MDETKELHIALARQVKIRKLIAALDVLAKYDWDLALHAAQTMTEEMWNGLAWRAHVNPPSELTSQRVVDALTERIAIRIRVKNKPGMRFGERKEVN